MERAPEELKLICQCCNACSCSDFGFWILGSEVLDCFFIGFWVTLGCVLCRESKYGDC